MDGRAVTPESYMAQRDRPVCEAWPAVLKSQALQSSGVQAGVIRVVWLIGVAVSASKRAAVQVFKTAVAKRCGFCTVHALAAGNGRA